MAEHYSKTTTEASVWCNKCGTCTMHNVFDGRRGACQKCIKRLEDQAAAAALIAPAATQSSLF